MKIAHLISTFLPAIGGAEICVHNIASEQARMGHTVKVIAPIKKKLPILNYGLLPLKRRSVFLSTVPFINKLYFVDQLRRYQDKYKFDIWQVTIGYPFGVAAIDFFKRENIPCMLRCSGEDIQIAPEIRYGARMHRWPDILIRKHYQQFDGVISIAESITQDYLNVGVKKEDIFYIPNGIDRHLFDLASDKNKIRKQFGIDASKKMILTIGRNHPKKGFAMIPDIIKTLSKVRDDFIWFLVGRDSGIIQEIARRKHVDRFLVVKEGLPEDNDTWKTRFPSRRLLNIYKSADIFVLPALIEGCSTVITEAMAVGLPVISNNVAGVKDMINHNETGLLCKKHDFKEMARNINIVMEDKALYGRIKKNTLARTRDLDWSTIAGKYINAYEEIIRRKNK